MGFLKVSNSIYGFNVHINLFKLNMQLKFFSSMDMESTAGLNNRTEDGKYCLFLDYDGMLYEEHLLSELRYLQLKHKLSSLYVFKSSQKEGSYHIICLDKLKAREWIMILEETSCDANFKKAPLITGCKAWVLRFLPKKESKKPELIKILKSRHEGRPKSNAHALFLKYNYDVETKSLLNLDDYTNVTLTTYQTLNYIKTTGGK